MAEFVTKNRVKETSATTGAGTYTLAGAVVSYQPFSVIGAAKITAYVAQDSAGGWEVGIGTVSIGPNQLTRDVILASSNSNAAVNWAAGTKTITACAIAELDLNSANTAIDPPCRFEWASATSCVLNRSGGSEILLKSNGIYRPRQIPAGGVSISTGGFAANTTYDMFAAWTGSAIALFAALTGSIGVDPDRNVSILSTDSTRRLVGRLRTNGVTQFVDSPAQRFVISWNQRRRVCGSVIHGSAVSTTSAPFVELSTARRVEFICWAQENVEMAVEAQAANTIAGSNAFLAIGVDGALDGRPAGGNVAVANGVVDLSTRHTTKLSGGYHFITPLVATGAGTASYAGNANLTQVITSG